MSDFWYPKDCSMRGFSVRHYLPEFAQTHVNWSGMLSNDQIFCCPLLLPSVFPSIRIFSISQHLVAKNWSFSFICLSNEYSGLISFKINWFDLLTVQGTLKSLLQDNSLKASSSLVLSIVYELTSVHDYWENHSFDNVDLHWQSDVSAF